MKNLLLQRIKKAAYDMPPQIAYMAENPAQQQNIDIDVKNNTVTINKPRNKYRIEYDLQATEEDFYDSIWCEACTVAIMKDLHSKNSGKVKQGRDYIIEQLEYPHAKFTVYSYLTKQELEEYFTDEVITNLHIEQLSQQQSQKPQERKLYIIEFTNNPNNNVQQTLEKIVTSKSNQEANEGIDYVYQITDNNHVQARLQTCLSEPEIQQFLTSFKDVKIKPVEW